MTDILAQIIYPVVEETRRSLPDAAAFAAKPETVLLGEGSALDSSAVVGFLVAVEERIEASAGKAIRLVSERAMSRSSSPFRTLGALAEYVKELLDEK